MFRLSYECTRRVLMVSFLDIVSSEDLQALDNALVHAAATMGPSHLLTDLSDAQAIAVPQSALVSRARREDVSPGWRRIIVAPREDFVEWARNFCEFRTLAGMRSPTVVSSKGEAFALLSLRAPRFEVICDPGANRGGL